MAWEVVVEMVGNYAYNQNMNGKSYSCGRLCPHGAAGKIKDTANAYYNKTLTNAKASWWTPENEYNTYFHTWATNVFKNNTGATGQRYTPNTTESSWVWDDFRGYGFKIHSMTNCVVLPIPVLDAAGGVLRNSSDTSERDICLTSYARFMGYKFWNPLTSAQRTAFAKESYDKTFTPLSDNIQLFIVVPTESGNSNPRPYLFFMHLPNAEIPPSLRGRYTINASSTQSSTYVKADLTYILSEFLPLFDEIAKRVPPENDWLVHHFFNTYKWLYGVNDFTNWAQFTHKDNISSLNTKLTTVKNNIGTSRPEYTQCNTRYNNLNTAISAATRFDTELNKGPGVFNTNTLKNELNTIKANTNATDFLTVRKSLAYYKATLPGLYESKHGSAISKYNEVKDALGNMTN